MGLAGSHLGFKAGSHVGGSKIPVGIPALGLFSTSCKAIMKASVLHNTVKELVVKQMDDDLEHLCRKQTNSILRQTKPAELVSFDMSKLVCELEKEAPFVWQVLKSVSFIKKQEKSAQ